MNDATAWIHALRTSHDRFRDLVSPLDDEAVTRSSFDPGWSIAEVASTWAARSRSSGCSWTLD
jgi:hypothetical protein